MAQAQTITEDGSSQVELTSIYTPEEQRVRLARILEWLHGLLTERERSLKEALEDHDALRALPPAAPMTERDLELARAEGRLLAEVPLTLCVLRTAAVTLRELVEETKVRAVEDVAGAVRRAIAGEGSVAEGWSVRRIGERFELFFHGRLMGTAWTIDRAHAMLAQYVGDASSAMMMAQLMDTSAATVPTQDVTIAGDGGAGAIL